MMACEGERARMQRSAPALAERIRQYSEELQRDPKSLTFALLADALREAGQLETARSVCQHGVRIHPNYVTGRIMLGQILLQLGNAAEARQEFENVLAQHPQNLVARMFLGQIFLDNGEFQAAAEHFRRILQLNPDNPNARRLLEQAQEALTAPAPAPQQPEVQVPAEGAEPGTDAEAAEAPERVSAILEQLLADLRNTEGVVGALLVGEDGLPVAGELDTDLPDSVMSAMVAEIGNSAKKYVGGMQLGEFVGGTIDGTNGNMVLYPMNQFFLVVINEPNAKLGLLKVQIDRARRYVASL